MQFVLLKFSFLLVFLTILLPGCSHQKFMDPFTNLLGNWKTEKGIIVSIQKSSDTEAEAAIKLTPGYRGEDIKSGKIIISAIKPFPGGGFSGSFEMPGGAKTVKLEISLLSRNTILILSRDKRVKGNRMLWRRVKKSEYNLE